MGRLLLGYSQHPERDMINLFLLGPCVELGLIYGLMGLGIYLTFRLLDWPDLTCDGSFVTGAAAYASCLGLGPGFGLCMALVSGAVMGVITGLLSLYGRVPKLLAGILVAFMIYPGNLRLLGGPNRMIPDHFFGEWPFLLTITLLMGLMVTFLLATQWGLGLRALGQNIRLSKVYQVPIVSTSLGGLALSNGLVGLSGALLSQYQGFVDVSQGVGSLILGLAAIMLGEQFFSSVSYAGLACILGAILYRIFIALALHVPGLETQDMNLVLGALVIIALWIPQRKRLCRT